MAINGKLHKILEAGICAPSGDNTQPWKFIVRDNVVELYNVPDKDQSLYNFAQNASMIAHGALIENIVIASQATGLRPAVTLFPNAGDPNLIASIVFEETQPQENGLCPYISRRATNRKPYKTKPLTQGQKDTLMSAVRDLGGNLIIKDDPDAKEILARALSKNEQLVFENAILHKFFFSHIHGSNEQIMNAGGGFPIKTLELPLPLTFAFSLFRIRPILKFFNLLGLSRSIPRQTAKNYVASSAFGAIVFPDNTRKDFFEGGRALERVWLEATRMNLSMQPLTGILFLWQRLLAGTTKELSPRHQEYIRESYQELERTFGTQGKTIIFIFRIGEGDAPSALTPRLPLDSFIA